MSGSCEVFLFPGSRVLRKLSTISLHEKTLAGLSMSLHAFEVRFLVSTVKAKENLYATTAVLFQCQF